MSIKSSNNVFGRRKSDLWLQALLQNVLQAAQKPVIGPNRVKQYRRPRRTKLQLRAAFKEAMAKAVQEHPEWPSYKISRYARKLVRTYQIVGNLGQTVKRNEEAVA